MPATVLIVDDHPQFRSVARLVLEGPHYHVVGEAEDGASALAAADALEPDLVLLDIQLPDTSGFEVARALAARPDPPAVVLVSSRRASDYGAQIERAAALGFIAKTDLSDEALGDLLP